MTTARFDHNDICRLYQAITDAHLAGSREALLAGIDPSFVAGLPAVSPPSSQVLIDLHRLNQVGRLADGSAPLEIWLTNAAALTQSLEIRRVFAEMLMQYCGQTVSTHGVLASKMEALPGHNGPPRHSNQMGATTVGHPTLAALRKLRGVRYYLRIAILLSAILAAIGFYTGERSLLGAGLLLLVVAPYYVTHFSHEGASARVDVYHVWHFFYKWDVIVFVNGEARMFESVGRSLTYNWSIQDRVFPDELKTIMDVGFLKSCAMFHGDTSLEVRRCLYV